MEKSTKKYCIRCKKNFAEITFILHEKFCEYISLEEFKYCQICDIYLDSVEYDDHMYCHDLEKDENTQENNIIKSNESFEIEKNYEFIDKESTLKEIGEQEIFEKKFAEASTKKNKKGNIFTKKIIPYLFSFENHYKMPRALIILIGIFGDPYLLIGFSLVELIDYWLGRSKRDHEAEEGLIELIPETKIEDINKLPEEKKSCIICLCDYEMGDSIMTLSCTHSFHTNCIKDWLNLHNYCPICKFAVKKDNYQP